MIALYNSTNGHSWYNNDNWLTDRPLYEWHGLKVDHRGRVTEIDLTQNGLTGSLPPELGNLDQLELLKLNAQRINGHIPREFGRLAKLVYINLEQNNLSGPIPHEIGILPELRHIDFANNTLGGDVPPKIASGTNIIFIDLSNNELTGLIPKEFADHSRIRSLRLDINQITGQIPHEIGRLLYLEELWLGNNQLSGEIPTSLSLLTELEEFTAYNNQLTGTIPEGFSNLRNLKELDLDNNMLTGTIPEGLGELKNLWHVSLVDNDFSGCIPSRLREAGYNNVFFANIEVCGQTARPVPAVPPHITLEIGDAATAAQTIAVQLATQWITTFTNELGLPTLEESITVYVNQKEGLIRDYAEHVNNCDLDCARGVFDDPDTAVTIGTAFVPLYGTPGDSLAFLAQETARLIIHALHIEQRYHHHPRWWSDGLATLLATLAVADGMGLDSETQRRNLADFVGERAPPLWELEREATTKFQPTGAAAIDFLASQVGLSKLLEMYTQRVPGESWRQTFARVFNISVVDFYDRFNEHRRNGFPLHELAALGNVNWPSVPVEIPIDRAPLVALYNATDGPNWQNNDKWLSDRPLSEWFGIIVNDDGRVTEIAMYRNGLQGELPPELFELDQLTTLYIPGSRLSGRLSPDFGRLLLLERLVLDDNDLTGPIPNEVGLLPNLIRLTLSGNRLSGEIPPSVMASSTLQEINLSRNDLNGSIPNSFAEGSQIHTLRLHSNQLTGEIPPQIGRLNYLGELTLGYNELTGIIPSSITALKDLWIFSVPNNQLTGSIPEGFTDLRRLVNLNFDGNQFTGEIPAGMGNLERLALIGIVDNQFTGCVPRGLRDVSVSNVDYANIHVCGEPMLTDPIIPEFVKLVFGESATPSQILASQRASQWLGDFTDQVAWPTPSHTIAVYVQDSEELAISYANHVSECDLKCAESIIQPMYPEATAITGAAFIPLFWTDGDILEQQARDTAYQILNAMQQGIGDRSTYLELGDYPAWWTQGLPDLFSRLAIATGRHGSWDATRRSIADGANDGFSPLWDLEDYAPSNSPPVGAAAIDLLASQVGLSNLINFYTEHIAGETWQQTFERVFTISVPDFYELFNDYQRDRYPHLELPLEGNTNWPER